jgi:hypothetical protein
MIRTSIVLLCLLIPQPPRPAAPVTPPAGVAYEAFAVRFGILPAFAVSGLVAGADRERKLDIPVMIWLLKGSDGHDPAVFERFERVAEGIVRIR